MPADESVAGGTVYTSVSFFMLKLRIRLKRKIFYKLGIRPEISANK